MLQPVTTFSSLLLDRAQDTKSIEVVDEQTDDLEVSEEDLAFVTENAHHLGFLASLDYKALDK